MPIKTVLFDLDGTLLPMDIEAFTRDYLKRLAAYSVPYGYEPKKLIEVTLAGTEAMLKNDGRLLNKEAFWQVFANAYGEERLADIPLFDRFYETEFDKAAASCGYQPLAKELISLLKDRGVDMVLATNPFFPETATLHRIKWAGLDPADFKLITVYENSRRCKPNLDYYRDIMAERGLGPAECLMVGNDVEEDMIARDLGMSVFLVTDCLINRRGNAEDYPHGSFEELLEYIKSSI